MIGCMENNLEVAGVDENEKVLFATHYLAGPARAWWTSARALNAGQMMTWADFKLKFSKYHVPPGLIKKMRDEFRELKQGRMSVVEYRDRFLTLSRYAPDETDTTEKRKERFLNGTHEMQTLKPDGGNPRPGGPHHNNNYVHHNSNYNRAQPRAPANNNPNNSNTAPRTGSNAIPVTPKDKATITCYECGIVGHYSNECPKRLAKLAGNTAPAQQQRRVSTGKKFAPNNPNNRGGRLYHMNAEEAQEAPDVVLGITSADMPFEAPYGRKCRTLRIGRKSEKAKSLDRMFFEKPKRRYQEETSVARGEEQLDMKTDVKMAENKNSADIITWREYEALRNEMRREFRTKDDELKSTVDEIKQTLDATNVTVTGLSDQMTDIQRNIADMRLAIENLTVLQQQQQEDDEDPELEDDAHNARGAPRGHRPRGWVPLGRNGRGQDEEDGLGKPKFSIPKFEGGADVEEYLTWELKIEKLWSLHPHYSEDRKIKLASSEFDGYALRWWDSLVRNLDEDGAQPIRTWHAMKEAMTSRFVPTNYMRNIFDKLTLLRQGVKTVDEYYMEMEMLMQRGRVRESLEMTMQRFLNGLKYDVKGIVRHYTYTNMNQLLHHAREAESQLAEEAKVKGRATGAGRFTPRAPSTAPAPSTRSAPYSTPPSKPVSNVSNAKKSESAASTSGSGVSTTRNRDMLCHTCGGKGHFKRDCPNRKVMFINEDNEYETGDDVDPNAPDDDDYDTDGEDAYPSDARTIVVSQRALNVLPSASTQRCNLFQTKALVGPDKACKVIIDGGSCRNLASKELCTKLKLKYLPHPHPYYIQWLSDNGEMKVNHMVRVEFAIGPYKDCIDFDVVPMTEFGDVFPEEVPAGLPPLRGIEHQIDLIPGASLPNRAPYRTNPEETKEIQKQESHAGGLMGHFGREKTLLMLADHFYWPKMRRDVDRYVRRCITCNKSKSKLKPHVYELLLEDALEKLGTKLLFSTTCHPQTDGQTEVVNRTLSQLLRSMIKKNLKEWEECLPHVEFAYNRAVHSTTELCPFEVVYGFKPITPLDLLPLPIHERVNMEASKRADYVKKIHEKTKELIEKKGKSNAARMNKKRKEMLFKPGDLVWVHFRKDRFPKLRKSKLKPRGDGPYKVLAKINDNAYSIDLPEDEFGVSNSFNVADLTPYDGEDLGASGYQEETSIARGEEQLDMKTDVKMAVKLDMELDMKISHGRAREEREACAREKKKSRPVQNPGPIERSRCVIQVIIHYIVVFLRCHHPVIIITTVAYEKIGPPLITSTEIERGPGHQMTGWRGQAWPRP
ncbi:hypothetical protein QYE76_068270 [Lolium multiflorum]|uniref:Gag-pol polyprotein n=1 Tax=Lolium multiflorum TaxID=4521 RepID=A0AAD8WCG9_LOLMU|nr:hypothetical protein QYE76_068270 [Lolium multiflorum]